MTPSDRLPQQQQQQHFRQHHQHQQQQQFLQHPPHGSSSPSQPLSHHSYPHSHTQSHPPASFPQEHHPQPSRPPLVRQDSYTQHEHHERYRPSHATQKQHSSHPSASSSPFATPYPAVDTQQQQRHVPHASFQMHQNNSGLATPPVHRPRANDSYFQHESEAHPSEGSPDGFRCSPVSSLYGTPRHELAQSHQEPQPWQNASPRPFRDRSPDHPSQSTYYPRSSYTQHLGHDQYNQSPQARTGPSYGHEQHAWYDQGPTSHGSYREEHTLEHGHAQTYSSQSDRHYVLTSVASSASSLIQRRLSISGPTNCSSFESVNHPVQPLPALTTSATSMLSSPLSTSPLSTTASSQRPPTHGDEPTCVLQRPQGRDNGPRMAQPRPTPIRTQLSKDSIRECPPLSFQSSSSQSTGGKSADSKTSPSTPRSSMLPVIMASSTLSDPQSTFEFSKGVHPALADHQSHYPHHQIQRPLYMFASPEDYRDNGHYREDHDMEHCSEQDDVREREHDDDEEDEDEDEDEALHARKIARHHRAADTKDRSVPNCAVQPARAGADEEDDLEENNSFASTCSSRKPSLTSSPLREESKAFRKIAKPKGGSQKRQASLQAVLDDAIAELEEDNHGQDGSGTQSLKGQGLGYYAPLVCDRVERRGVTTYNDLVHDLAGNQHTERAEGAASQEQGNIRRRVYDALNILEALGIIAMDKKEIRWIGIHDSKPIRDVSRKVQLTNPTYQNAYPSPRLQHRERDGADESEEPEDDEMEIEQLQKEVEAMKLRNALELARLQDQVARHVQVNNLIERNKAREEKELERQMRRRQKKQERKEEKRALAVAATGSDSMEVDDEPAELDGSIKKAERRHHRHSRHRSPRLEDKKNDNDEDGDEESGDARQGKGTAGEEVDEETARRIRKQERRERRERKERRAQRRQEKEAAAASHDKEQRIQLPFVGVRIPLYAGQSSDSEASISVVRRVREEPRSRKSGKSKKHDAIGDETTMVEIKIPHQEELSIISDTEILGEMGLNQVPLTDLKAMLPQEAFDKARYTTATVQDIVDSGNENMCVVATVRGGFERALVCSGVAH